MTPRKLLMVAYHFPPCAAVAVHRMIGLAKHLPARGWHSVVVAPPNPPHEPSDPGLLNSIPADATKIISVPFAEGFWGKVNRKFFPNKLWAWKAWRAAVRAVEEHKPDAIFTSHPPDCMHEIGLALKRRFNLPWIADFRDPWFALNRKLPNPRRTRRFQANEAETMRLADRIVGISPLYSDGLREAYPQHADKIITITNGYDPETFAEALTPPPRDRLSILYTGELYFGRDPRPFLDALRELETTPDAPKVGFQFLGRWSEDVCDLPAEVKSRDLESAVQVSGLVPYRECLRTMMQADILLLIHTPGYTHGLPAKIFEYIGARRPILVLTEHEGDIGWVLKKSGHLHRLAPMRDVAKIKQAIIELAQEVRRGAPVSPPGMETAFTREQMAMQFAEQLDAISAAADGKTGGTAFPGRPSQETAKTIGESNIHRAIASPWPK